MIGVFRSYRTSMLRDFENWKFVSLKKSNKLNH